MRYPTTTYKRIDRAGDINITVDVEALSRLREVFLIAMVAVSLLSFVSLFEFNPAVHHGYAYALSIMFGSMRYACALLFAYAGITFYIHWNRLDQTKTVFYLKLIGASLVFSSITCLYAKDGQGGLFGSMVFNWISASGSMIVWILSLSTLLSGIFLMTRLSWYRIGIFSYQFVRAFLYFQQVRVLRRRSRVIDMEPQSVSPRREWLPPSSDGQQHIQKALVLEDPKALQLTNTLQHFGIEVSVSSKEVGPVFTRYEIDLLPGVKSSAICNLRKDIARNMLVDDVRIIEVIPGKSCIGIEIPNENREICRFEELQDRLDGSDCKIPLLLGKSSSNEIKIVDLEAMPHLLIAGSSGSGKTMLLQSILMSLTSIFSPSDLQIILIDTKLIAFAQWKNAPHVVDVISNVEDALSSLNWCVNEMEKRYAIMAQDRSVKFPKIVVVVDEFADLISSHKIEIESNVRRLAQKARQSQIHLVLSTQRPTVDVITGHIKANISVRIALAVSDKLDSRIILDEAGAEVLLGQGDMLFKPLKRKAERIHAPFVSDELIAAHVSLLSGKNSVPSENVMRSPQMHSDPTVIENPQAAYKSNIYPVDFKNLEKVDDEKYLAVVQFVKETGRASASAIQSEFGIGYPRALKIMNTLRDRGVIGEPKYHNGPCSVLI